MYYLGEMFNLLGNESQHRETIQKLEAELGVYKRAYADVDAELRQVEKVKQEAEKQRDDLESQLKASSVSP